MSEPSKPSTTANPAPITIDGVTVGPIRFREDLGGFLIGTFEDDNGELCVLADANRCGPSAIRLGFMGNPMVLTRAHVAALLPHLQRFVERGALDAETPPPINAGSPCDNCGHLTHCSGAGWYRCHQCGNAMRVEAHAEAKPAGVAVIDNETA